MKCHIKYFYHNNTTPYVYTQATHLAVMASLHSAMLVEYSEVALIKFSATVDTAVNCFS